MERSPSEEGSACSVSQEFPSFPCNPKVQYRVPNGKQLAPMQGQLDQKHNLDSILIPTINLGPALLRHLYPSISPIKIVWPFLMSSTS